MSDLLLQCARVVAGDVFEVLETHTGDLMIKHARPAYCYAAALCGFTTLCSHSI